MTDEQNQGLHRIRQWRERDRAVVQPARGDAPSFDLFAAIVECGATPADWRSLEPVLEPYHGEATSQLRHIADEEHDCWMRVHDGLVKAGVTEAMLTMVKFDIAALEAAAQG